MACEKDVLLESTGPFKLASDDHAWCLLHGIDATGIYYCHIDNPTTHLWLKKQQSEEPPIVVSQCPSDDSPVTALQIIEWYIKQRCVLLDPLTITSGENSNIEISLPVHTNDQSRSFLWACFSCFCRAPAGTVNKDDALAILQSQVSSAVYFSAQDEYTLTFKIRPEVIQTLLDKALTECQSRTFDSMIAKLPPNYDTDSESASRCKQS